MTDRIWPDFAIPQLLQIYGQSYEHGPAVIHGTPEALRRLGEACLAAANNKTGKPLDVDMMANDGEGYRIAITPQNEKGMQKLLRHYSVPDEYD